MTENTGRSDGLLPQLAAMPDLPQKCPRCDTELPAEWDVRRRGRRRVWCSNKCRRAAHTERLAAERAGMAVQVVEVPRGLPVLPRIVAVPRELTSAELAYQMLDDPEALETVLRWLTARAAAKKLDKRVRAECLRLAHVLLPNSSRY